MFDLEGLDDTRVREFYTCGIHEEWREVMAHWEVCRKLTCSRCGEVSVNSFMANLNHGIREDRLLCEKQLARLNHVYRCDLQLRGEWIHTAQTNCFAPSHRHGDRKQGNYWAKGGPVECIQAERDELAEWLLAHSVPYQLIGLPVSRSRFESVSS
jgi:hypothetical protein